MASNLNLANRTVTEEAATLNTDFNGAYLHISGGTQPINGDTGLEDILVSFTLPNPCFTGINGVLVLADPTPLTAIASGTETATWFRIISPPFGSYNLMDGSVGVSGSNCDLILNNTAIQDGATVTISSFTYTVTK